MTRAERRINARKAKAHARRIRVGLWGLNSDARQVGRAAAMHCTCPCGMCTHREPDERERFDPKLHDFDPTAADAP